MYYVTIELQPSSDTLDNPSEFDVFEPVSFSRNHFNFNHPDNYFPASIGLRRKLTTGTAFLLDYYEHGSCVWSLANEGPSCRFDQVRAAGLLFLRDGGHLKTFEERQKAARRFLLLHNDWCNGHGVMPVLRLYCTFQDNDCGFQQHKNDGNLMLVDTIFDDDQYASDEAGQASRISDLIVSLTNSRGPVEPVFIDCPSKLEAAVRDLLNQYRERGRAVLDGLPHGDRWLATFALRSGWCKHSCHSLTSSAAPKS